jgi:hypothetical protein
MLLAQSEKSQGSGDSGPGNQAGMDMCPGGLDYE